MTVQSQLCFLLFGTCLVSFLLLLECRKLEGYAFPVFSTKECPRSQAEWNNRSSVINCTEINGYMCLPNENFTNLLEFCYIYPRILVQKDLCLYLVKRYSRVNSYNCRNFTNGCPELSYFSSETYVHPSCMEIENGCFSAEPSCKRQPLPSESSIDDTTLTIILGVSIPACLLCILVCYVIIRKYRISKRESFIERNDVELHHLLPRGESMDSYEEPPNEKAIFNHWEKDDFFFISTKACKEVEKLIKNRNLVIVAGNSGSGKSAIIQHIALKYRKRKWIVKRVKNVGDIVNKHSLQNVKKIIFVLNDPFGKESCDEILMNSWQMYKKELKPLKDYFRKVKLLMSCRNNIMSDARVTRFLVNKSDIVDIDNEQFKLSVDEKRQILTKYTPNMNFSDNQWDTIVEVENYFPLLCKLYSCNKKYQNKGTDFFTEPVTMLKEEVIGFSKNDKKKYCALALLILFNDDLCIKDLLEKKDTKKKFKHTLKLCGLPDNISPEDIGYNLDSLNVLVKKVGDKYHFYHDLVMEITTQVFRTDYPDETIKFADIGFLRKRVRLGDCEEHNDPFTVYLTDIYIQKLAERLFTELFGNRFIDVVLNPCMKKTSVIGALTKIIKTNPKKLQLLFKKKEYNLEMLDSFYRKAKEMYLSKLAFICCNTKLLYVSKLAFICLEKKITPLFVLIVFGHTDFSLECLKAAQQIIGNSIDSSLFHAVCCNGSMNLFHLFSKDHVEKSLENKFDNKWKDFHPIHIVIVYHNYEILEELIKIGVKINSESLLLAVGNDTQKYGDYNHEDSGATRRDSTVQILLNNGAEFNLERKNVSPLYRACEMGHDSTVQLLLSNKANINLDKPAGASPLYIACKNGHDSTVQLLLSKQADINLCTQNRTSPLCTACQYGHYNTVQLLLSNGADINSYMKRSPLYIACQNGHESIIQLLLSNGADINLSDNYGVSPLQRACENGDDSTVQLLLREGADVNLCNEDGLSPLHIACRNGDDSTVQLLLRKGADIDLCAKYGTSPLYMACYDGHDSTVQLLLSNEADINLCTEYGKSPLDIACENGHDSTVQILLSHGAAINLSKKNGAGPLYIDCQKGHDSTVQL